MLPLQRPRELIVQMSQPCNRSLPAQFLAQRRLAATESRYETDCGHAMPQQMRATRTGRGRRQAAKLEPHPQVDVAFGFSNVNPLAFKPSW